MSRHSEYAAWAVLARGALKERAELLARAAERKRRHDAAMRAATYYRAAWLAKGRP